MALKLKALKKYKGVYYNESQTKLWRGKPDRVYYVRFKDSTGREVRVRIGALSDGITPEIAQEELMKLKVEYRDKPYLTRREKIKEEKKRQEELRKKELKEKKKRISLSEVFFKHYLPALESDNKKSTNTDCVRFKKWIEPIIGDRPIREINPLDLERIKKKMRDSHMSDTTVGHVLGLVRNIFNRAIKWGLCENNPTVKIKIPSTKNNRRERFLSMEEAKVLLEELSKHSPQTHDEALISLHCGLRAREIFNLTWADLDFENGIIYIRDPKNNESRHAYMTPQVKEMLLRRKDMSDTVQPSNWVFPNRYGQKKEEVSDTFERVVAKLGLNNGITDRRQKVVFHTLRHTFASWLALQGTPLYTIKELMGHKDIKMTERYAHLIPDHKRKAVESLAQAFKETEHSETNLTTHKHTQHKIVELRKYAK